MYGKTVSGEVDFSEAEDENKNPFHVNIVAYLTTGSYNLFSKNEFFATSYTSKIDLDSLEDISNKEANFYVWARNPCRKTSLVVDDYVHSNKTLTYFIGAPQKEVSTSDSTDGWEESYSAIS